MSYIKFILVAVYLFQMTEMFSQDTIRIVPPAHRTIYGEAFGQALYYSLNYDQLLTVQEGHRTSFTLGGTVIPTRELGVYAGSGSFNFLIGKRCHFFELGIGLTGMQLVQGNVTSYYSYTNPDGIEQQIEFQGYEKDYFVFATPKIGYRYQHPSGGFFFRATFTPPIGIFSYYGPLIDYQTGQTYNNFSYYILFKEAAFFGSPVFPWAGLSFGFTLR